MTPLTTETLRVLRETVWFSRVGIPEFALPEFVSSWAEAMATATDPTWDEIVHEAANRLRERILERDRARFAQWNETVRALKPTSMMLVQEKTADVIARHALPKTFLAGVNWDILALLLECEFNDVVPPGFFAAQGYWYVQGHYPCGWRGKFPQGRPLVF